MGNNMEYVNTLSSQQPYPRGASREWGPSLRLHFPPRLKQRVGPDERQGLKMLLFIPVLEPYCGEGNGTPLQYSCLENPMDGRAW